MNDLERLIKWYSEASEMVKKYEWVNSCEVQKHNEKFDICDYYIIIRLCKKWWNTSYIKSSEICRLIFIELFDIYKNMLFCYEEYKDE